MQRYGILIRAEEAQENCSKLKIVNIKVGDNRFYISRCIPGELH